MTKDVLLTISGLQVAQEADSEPVEVITPGDYYKKNNKHYIIYDEVMEGFEGVTKNIIKIGNDCLDITKKGVANVHMVFEKNKKNLTCYETPYGSLMIGISAQDITIAESDTNICVDVKYVLELNYEHLADCNIRMKIMSKENRDFHLCS